MRPKSMNQTESLTYDWLLSEGYAENDITFQPRRSPDFLTSDGKCWETKFTRNNSVAFTTFQIEGLKGCGCTVVLYEAASLETAGSPEPTALFPYDDIAVPGRHGKFRFTLQEPTGAAKSIRMTPTLWAAIEAEAARQNRSVTNWLATVAAKALEETK